MKQQLHRHFFLRAFAAMLCLMATVGSAWAEDKWVKVDPSTLVTGDIVVIVNFDDGANDNTGYAMSNDNGTSTAPAATRIAIEENVEEYTGTIAAKYQWEVTASDNTNSYQFKVPGTSNYLYCTNSNNGVRVGTNANNTFTLKTEGNHRSVYLYNTATSRYVGCYQKQDWRCYTSINSNINGNIIGYYKKTTAVTDKRTPVNITSFTATATELTRGETTTTSVLTDVMTFVPAITYTSSDDEVATVDADGVITAVRRGTATITATLNLDDENENYKAGTTLSKSVEITVHGQTHTAYFYANGEVFSSVQVEEESPITFPVNTPEDVNGKVFMGWADSTIDGVTTQKPYLVDAASMGNADRTFYAVYASVTVGEAEEKLTQTLAYDTWTYSGSTTDKNSYRLFGNGAYVESVAFDLSKLAKVKIYGGTYGGSGTYKTITIGDGTNVWKNGEMTGTNNAKEHTFTDGTALAGTKPLRIISTCGDGSNNGIRMSKIEIFTNEPTVDYTDYCTTVAADTRIDPELALTAERVSMNAGLTKELSTLYTVVSDGEVTVTSNDDEVATISDGMLVAVAPGTATVTISVAATEHYDAATKTLPVAVTVYPATAPYAPAAGSFTKVTATEDIVDGDYLIVYEDGDVAFNGGLETLDAVGNTIKVSIYGTTISSTDETNGATFTIDTAAGTLKSKSGKYIGVTSNSNGLKQTDDATTYTNTFAIDDDGNAVITAVFEGSTMGLCYNSDSGQKRFRYFKNAGQKPVQLYRLMPGAAEVTIGTAQWRTLVSSVALQFPEEVKAYIVTATGEEATLSRVLKVAAGVPVLLSAAAGTYGLTVVDDADCDDTSANLLRVSEQDTQEAFVLSNKNNGVGFYRWTGGWMGAGRVYLPVATAVNARSFLAFGFGETTAISTADAGTKGSDRIYSLSGQRVEQPRKGGLYIVNGKKMVIR